MLQVFPSIPGSRRCRRRAEVKEDCHSSVSLLISVASSRENVEIKREKKWELFGKQMPLTYVRGILWRCLAELNRSNWFCRPVPNLPAQAPIGLQKYGIFLKLPNSEPPVYETSYNLMKLNFQVRPMLKIFSLSSRVWSVSPRS